MLLSGYRFDKRPDSRVSVKEQFRVREQRYHYLRMIRNYQKEGRPIVYLDETWVNTNISKSQVWIDPKGAGGYHVPAGKGRRLILLHAGHAGGWIDNAMLLFQGKKGTGDYHNEMNTQR